MLAESDLEPLILADGTKIDPTTGKAIKEKKAQSFVEVPSGIDAQQLVARTRKTVAELPLPPEQLSGVALVAFYTLFGLPDAEIAIATNSRLSIPQIKQIRELDAYKDFMTTAKDNILNTAVDQVREKFQKHAINAANKVIELAQSENEVLAFKASQDVLDRSGHRPADVVEHRHKMEDALNIVFIHKNEGQEVPTIDVTPDKVFHHASST